MVATLIEIEKLAAWSEPKRVETRQGPRNLRTAPATDLFWQAWRSDKAALKATGVSCSRDDRTGAWNACWWLPLAAEEVAKIEEATAASRATDADVEVPCPDGLAYLPYQRAGIAYAINRDHVLIGDEMGLGKTIQAIGIYNADPSLQRVVIICPASLRLNWAKEWAKWSCRPASIAVITGGAAADWRDADITIINYDIVQKHRERIAAAGIDLLVVDEAHYLKNPKAQRTTAILGSKDKKGEWLKQPLVARRRLFLTGTPIVNRPIELWPLVQALDPEGLGKKFTTYAWRYTNAHHNGYGYDFTGATRLDELQRKMREKFLVRRLKAEVLKELPAKQRQVIVLPANGASAAVDAEQAAYARYEDALAVLEAEAELAKAESDAAYDYACGEIRSHKNRWDFTEMSKARHETALAKVPHVIEHLTEAMEEGPVVCFAHHRDVVARIAEAFTGRCVTLTGETKMEDRQAAVDRFQNGEVGLFIGNIQAAGVGLTLTRSSRVVFAELDWVPGNMTQAEDRCHRIGQTDSVLVQHIVLEGSLDERMAEMLIAKQKVLDAALDNPLAAIPVAPAGNVPATVEIKPDKMDEAAAKITAEQIAAIHTALRMLAGMCDGARELDGCGFNKVDTHIGKRLAAQPSLTPRQAMLGQKFARKYHRQLPEGLLAQV